MVIFIEYFAKWVEAYVVEDQTSETIARLLADSMVCRHGVPVKLLSDQGLNLLPTLIMEVCGIKKINQLHLLSPADTWPGGTYELDPMRNDNKTCFQV